MRLSDNVGDTPLIPITLGNLTVWGKAEFMNPGGSVKDRMATYILNDAEVKGLIKKGDTLCEATSGNTGIAFAMLAYMMLAGVFSVKFSSDEVGVGFNPSKIVTRFMSDVESLVESVK